MISERISMTSKKLLGTALLSLSIATSPQLQAGEQAHAIHSTHSTHAAHENLSLELNQGKKWNTDTPLRTGMEAIRGAMASQLAQIHSDSLPAADYQALANNVQTQVQYM